MRVGEHASPRAFARGRLSSRIVLSNQSVCRTCAVKTNGFCSRLEPETLDILTQRRQHMELPEGAPVPMGEFLIVTRGVLRLVQTGEDGRRRILGVTFQGEAVLPEEQRDGISLEAATDATLCRIQPSSRQAAMALGKDLRAQVFRLVRAKQDRARHLAVVLATLGPDERLRSFLYFCTAFMPWEPLPGGGVLTMQLDRQDLAALLGTTPETICRALREFDRSGLIRMLDPRHFVIPDLERLRAGSACSALVDATDMNAGGAPGR